MYAAFSTIIDHTDVTAENLDELRERTCEDQARELAIGDETWGIIYEGGQRGQMSRYKASGRGAVAFGGASIWGDWVPTPAQDQSNVTLPDMLLTDDGEYYSEYGERLCKHGYALRDDADRPCGCEAD